MKLFAIIPFIILFSRTIAPIDTNLTNTSWLFVKIENTAKNETYLADTTCWATLNFNNEGEYNGSSVCNYYFGSCIIKDDENISISHPSVVKRVCQCQIISLLFDNLYNVNQYTIRADTLTLSTDIDIKITFKKK